MSLSYLSINYFQIVPKNILSFIYALLDRDSACRLSQTDSLLKRVFSSVETQKMLLPIHFGLSSSPSIFPPIHYHRLLYARSKNAEITLERTIFLEQQVICHSIGHRREFILTVPFTCKSSKDDEVRLIDLRRGTYTKFNIETLGDISSVCLKNEASLIIGFYEQTKLEFWDEKECITIVDAANEQIAFRFWEINSNGKTAISVHYNDKSEDDFITEDVALKFWDLDKKTCTHTLENLSICVDYLTMIPNSTKFLTFTQSKDAENQKEYCPIIWDFSTKESIKILLNLDFAAVDNQKFTADRSKVLFQSSHSIVFCETSTGEKIHELEHEDISNFTMNKKGNLALTMSRSEQGSNFKVWDLITGECVNTFFSDVFKISEIQIEELGLKCWVADADTNKIKILDLKTGKFLQSFEFYEWCSLVFTLDGTMAFNMANDFLQVYNLAPLPIERITNIASFLIQNASKELKEEEFVKEIDSIDDQIKESIARLPLAVQEVLKKGLIENNVEILLEYIEKEFVSDLMGLFKKASLLINNNREEAKAHLDHAHSLLECLCLQVANLELKEKLQGLFFKECIVQLKLSIQTRDVSLIFMLIDVIKDVILIEVANEDRASILLEVLETRLGSDFRALFISAMLLYFEEALLALNNDKPDEARRLVQSVSDLTEDSSEVKCLCLEECLNELMTHISSQDFFLTSLYLDIIHLIDSNIHQELSKEFERIREEEENEPSSSECFLGSHLSIIQSFRQTLSTRLNPLKRSAEELSEIGQPPQKRSRKLF